MKDNMVPNFTQMPNVLLDTCLIKSNAAFRVMMAICRKTYGYHKNKDKISISQLIKMTGLSNSGVIKALTELELLELISVTKKEGNTSEIVINVASEQSSPVEQVASEQSSPPPVNRVHRQNKELNKEATRTSQPVADDVVFEDYVQVLKKDKNRHIRIIGYYLEQRAQDFDMAHLNTKRAFSELIKRHTREAKQLSVINTQSIKSAFDQVRKDSQYGKKFEWKLSTILKKLI